VPLSSLLFETEGPVVQVIRDNRVETRRVTIGVFVKGSILIRDGVAEGDLVVVRAGAFLRDGDRVRAVVSGD
jgi:HlyD family secretion protein